MDALPIVIGALNEGFLATLKLFVVTLVGAIPLGLVVAFGSMSRWTPFRRMGIWMQRRLPSMGEGGQTAVLSLWQSWLRHIADFGDHRLGFAVLFDLHGKLAVGREGEGLGRAGLEIRQNLGVGHGICAVQIEKLYHQEE